MLGTFQYSSIGKKSLTITGSSSNKVILDGDHTDLILNFKPYEDYESQLILSNISLINGQGAIETYGSLSIDNCIVSHSKEANPIYFKKGKSLNISNSTISDNEAPLRDGSAGLYISYWGGDLKIENTIFKENTAKSGAAAIYMFNVSTLNISQTSFIENNGSVIYVTNSGKLDIIDSVFEGNKTGTVVNINIGYNNEHRMKGVIATNNQGSNCSFFKGENLRVENSIFSDNISTDSSLICTYGRKNLEMINSLLVGNAGGISFKNGMAIILNSIFLDNSHDINILDEISYAKIYNSYLNPENQVLDNQFNFNNIYTGINLGFVNQAIGDFRLTSGSDLINAGTTDIVDIATSETDLDGNTRVFGGTIDIGPYEYQSLD